MIEIDCAQYPDAGGQILRTALGLSALLQKEIKISNIRAGRPKPGLQPQHLASVKTIASVCNAHVQGADPKSKSLAFSPGKISSAQLNVNIGTAGSLTLMLQQLYPVSLIDTITLRATGGSHVAFAPTSSFVQEVLLPQLHKMGARLDLDILCFGYFPKGMGRMVFSSHPAKLPLKPLKIISRGDLHFVKCYSNCSGLPREVAESQAMSALKLLQDKIHKDIEWMEHINTVPSRKETIGSAIDLFAFFDTGVTLAGNALGEKGKPAEDIGKLAAENLLKQYAVPGACDVHLADQLIPFLALAKGTSELQVTEISQHILTNIQVTKTFLPEAEFIVEEELGKPGKITVKGIAYTGT